MRKKVKKKRKIVRISDLSIPEDFSLQETGTTQSLLAKFLKCRRLFLFAINKYYVQSFSKAIHFGNLGHDMLKQWYKTGKYSINSWRDEEIRLDEQEIQLQKAKMECIMQIYVKVYKGEKLSEVEEVFEYEFFGYKLLIKVDGLKIGTNFIRPTDHKTSGRIEEATLLDGLEMDFQLLFYASAIDNYESKKCNGADYNVIRNPGIKLTKGETLKQYRERLLKEIKKKPEHYFKRFEITLTRKDIEDYKSELKMKLDEMQMVIDGTLPIYRDELSCTGGKFNCGFLKTCISGNMALCKKGKYVHRELYK